MKKNERTHFPPQGEPESRYKRAREQFDKLIGDSLVRAKNWRLAFFLAMGALTICLIGLIHQSTKATVTPYVVEVNEQGQVRLVGKAVPADYQPKLAAIKHFLSRFVSEIRGIPTDPIVLKSNFLEAYNFVTAKGKNTLNSYAREYDPFAKIGEKAVSVEISSVIKMSEQSYQVNWMEQIFSKNGVPTVRQRYTGVFNLAFQTPKNEKVLAANPLGIFIDFFNISKKVS